MADPHWIERTALLSLVLGGPAVFLLTQVVRNRTNHPEATLLTRIPLWTGVLFVVTFIGWFLNVTFEISVSIMIGWPLLGILLSFLGCILASIPKTEERFRLATANGLLLLLALISVIAPN